MREKRSPCLSGPCLRIQSREPTALLLTALCLGVPLFGQSRAHSASCHTPVSPLLGRVVSQHTYCIYLPNLALDRRPDQQAISLLPPFPTCLCLTYLTWQPAAAAETRDRPSVLLLLPHHTTHSLILSYPPEAKAPEKKKRRKITTKKKTHPRQISSDLPPNLSAYCCYYIRPPWRFHKNTLPTRSAPLYPTIRRLSD